MDSTIIQVPQTETVSQSEIEKLLSQVGGSGMAAAAETVLAGQPGESREELLQVHEFPQLSTFPPDSLRLLRVRHEDYVRALAARLTMYLRLECGLQMTRLETVSFQQWLGGLATPTHLTLLRLDPLRGTCFFNLPSRLALCLVDRELGGPAVCLDENREISKLEAQLLARVVEIFAGEWCGVWSDLLDVRPSLLGHESNGGFLKTYPPGTSMMVLGLEVHLAQTTEHVDFAFPYFILEPLLAKANEKTPAGEGAAGDHHTAAARWNPALNDVPVTVAAELKDVDLSARALAQLKPGDLLPLPPEMAGQIQLRLANAPKFIGHLGTCDDHWAVKITQVLNS